MIKVAIVGYGNLGKGVEKALAFQSDMECVGIFTRRDPELISSNSAVYKIEEIKNHKIDVAILCGGSATDLMLQGPELIKDFNIVDSFDTHAKIPEHYERLNKVARENNRLGMISSGWDPGLFSLMRLLGEAILPQGSMATFWGKGVSQGHSDAIRRIEGVKYGIQYTIPKKEAIDKTLAGNGLNLQARDRHLRICYVVLDENAKESEVKEKIVTMPHYFSDYDTEVNFISEEEFFQKHNKMPHGGMVIHHAKTSKENSQAIQFQLTLESNPEFTASVNVACARAVYRAHQEGRVGVVTMFDIPLSYLSPKSDAVLRKELL